MFVAEKWYTLFHIHFQLLAGIFDVQLILMWKSVLISPTVFLSLKNGGFLGSSLISYSYCAILVVSDLKAAIINVCGHGLWFYCH